MIINLATMRLVQTQNSDGGWEWDNPDIKPSTGVPSPPNTIGVTALGVLEAYRELPNGDFILATQNLMGVCTPAYNLMVTNSDDPSPSKHRIRGPDITFLARLTQFIKNKHYADFAKDRWLSAKNEFGSGTPTGFAEFIRNSRKSQGLRALISWDINLYIQGLLALHEVDPDFGFDMQAKEMTQVIYESLYVPPLDFDRSNQNQTEYWCGITGVLEAFVTTLLPGDRIYNLIDALVGGQQSDGRWIGVIDGSDNQTTAYAVMALTKARKLCDGYHQDLTKVISAAISYLEGQQLTNGGFEYKPGTENTEVTSEVIQAVSSI